MQSRLAGPQAVICLTASRWEPLSVLWRVMLAIALLFLASYSQPGCLKKSDVSVEATTVAQSAPQTHTHTHTILKDFFDASTVSKQSCLSGLCVRVQQHRRNFSQRVEQQLHFSSKGNDESRLQMRAQRAAVDSELIELLHKNGTQQRPKIEKFASGIIYKTEGDDYKIVLGRIRDTSLCFELGLQPPVIFNGNSSTDLFPPVIVQSIKCQKMVTNVLHNFLNPQIVLVYQQWKTFRIFS